MSKDSLMEWVLMLAHFLYMVIVVVIEELLLPDESIFIFRILSFFLLFITGQYWYHVKMVIV